MVERNRHANDDGVDEQSHNCIGYECCSWAREGDGWNEVTVSAKRRVSRGHALTASRGEKEARTDGASNRNLQRRSDCEYMAAAVCANHDEMLLGHAYKGIECTRFELQWQDRTSLCFAASPEHSLPSRARRPGGSVDGGWRDVGETVDLLCGRSRIV